MSLDYSMLRSVSLDDRIPLSNKKIVRVMSKNRAIADMSTYGDEKLHNLKQPCICKQIPFA